MACPFRNHGAHPASEIPEGTLVEWSLSYQLGGIFSGLRNSLRIQRQFEKTMAESLKALYTHVRKAGSEHDVNDAKSLMRDAPNYEARAQYVPRHPSRYAERTEEKSGDSEPLIPEPAFTEDDTRPNPALAAVEDGDSAPAIREPVELEPVTPSEPSITDDIDIPGSALNDDQEVAESEYSRFKPPARDDTQDTHEEDATELAGDEDTVEDIAQEIVESVAASITEIEDASEHIETAPETEQAESISQSQAQTAPANDPMGPKIDTADIDTKEISIWEVFGVPRPSDTRPIQAVTAEASEGQSPAETPAPAAEAPGAPEDTQPIAASSSEVEAAAESTTLAADEPEMLEAPISATDFDATVVASRVSLEPLPHIPSLPYGFRLHARRKWVKLRRRSEQIGT